MKVFCLISDERAFRSESPAIYSEILRRSGIQGAYVPFKVSPDQLGQAIQGIRVLNIAGANVTVPYKEAVMPYLDSFSEGANMIGAINTIVRHGDELKGYNTNAIGFMDALRDINFDVAGKTALVVGNGGMAKAIVFILNWLLADTIYIAARNQEKTGRIVNKIGGRSMPLELLTHEPVAADIVINATSVSDPEESPEMAALVQGLQVPGCGLLVDLNYGRRKNFWEEWALRREIAFLGGQSTLAHQARRSFLLWTGVQIPAEEFRQVLDRSGRLSSMKL
jgi:shikimate dehydrogenase